jgi:hypothetical protein
MADAKPKIKCTVCGIAGNPGEFCMNGCGRLPDVGVKPAPSARDTQEARQAIESTPAPAVPHSEDYEASGQVPDVFSEGCTLALRLRVLSRRASCPTARLRLCADGETLAESRPAPLLAGIWTDMPLNFTPPRAGVIAASLVLDCGDGEDAGRHESDSFPLTVFPSSSARDGAFSISVTNQFSGITVDRAADATFGAAPGDLAAALREAAAGNGVRNILERGAASGPSRSFPLRTVRLPSRLTLLDADGRALHVISGATLRFGRSRTSDVVLRVFREDGLTDDRLSLAISKTHFSVEYDGSRCMVADGGRREGDDARVPSKFGTAVGGMTLPAGGSAPLPAGRDCEIGIAPLACGNGVPVLSLQAVAERCPQVLRHTCGRRCPLAATASLLISGLGPGASEAILAVWKCADIGGFFPALAGYHVLWDGVRLTIQAPGGAERPLAAGDEIGPTDHPVSAIPYRRLA